MSTDQKDQGRTPGEDRAYRLGRLAMAARLYLITGRREERDRLIALVDAECPHLAPISYLNPLSEAPLPKAKRG